jgi:hypothetical protein
LSAAPERSEQSDAGYPEEGPPGADPGGGGESEVREKARPEREAERAPDNDDGKATGNPKSAG